MTNWSGIIAFEGVLTGDGRYIMPGALTWTTPMPLRYVQKDIGEHDGAEVIGLITSVERLSDGSIYATGNFDVAGVAGAEVARKVTAGYMGGVSIDPGAYSGGYATMDGSPVLVFDQFEVRGATLVDIPAFRDARISVVPELPASNVESTPEYAFANAIGNWSLTSSEVVMAGAKFSHGQYGDFTLNSNLSAMKNIIAKQRVAEFAKDLEEGEQVGL